MLIHWHYEWPYDILNIEFRLWWIFCSKRQNKRPNVNMNSIPERIIITFNEFILSIFYKCSWMSRSTSDPIECLGLKVLLPIEWMVTGDPDRRSIKLLQFTTVFVPICLYLFTFFCIQKACNKHALKLLCLNSLIWINLIYYIRNGFIW